MPRHARLFSRLHAARWVLVVPFLLAALLAPGTMPRLEHGHLTLVLCADHGPAETVIDLATGLEVPAEDRDDARCDWAAAQLATLLAPPAAGPVLAVDHTRVQPVTTAAIWRAGPLPGAVTARGPPALL